VIAFDNAKYLRFTESELLGDCAITRFTGDVCSTNSRGDSRIDDSGSVRYATRGATWPRISSAAFGSLIEHVLLLRPLNQMRGIDAQGCIADVHDDVIPDHRLFEQLKSKSVSIDQLAYSQDVERRVRSVVRPYPPPTAIGVNANALHESTLDLLPERFVQVSNDAHAVPPKSSNAMQLYSIEGQRAIAEHIREHILVGTVQHE